MAQAKSADQFVSEHFASSIAAYHANDLWFIHEIRDLRCDRYGDRPQQVCDRPRAAQSNWALGCKMSYATGSIANDLYMALLRKEYDRARKLLEGRDINDPIEGSERPIHVACAAQCLEFVRYLVEERGADVNVEAEHHYTPIDATWWHAEGPMGHTSPSAFPIAAYLSSKGGVSNVMRK